MIHTINIQAYSLNDVSVNHYLCTLAMRSARSLVLKCIWKLNEQIRNKSLEISPSVRTQLNRVRRSYTV